MSPVKRQYTISYTHCLFRRYNLDDLIASSLSPLTLQLGKQEGKNELGVQLLHRNTWVVTPTETGMAFHERCVEILASLEEAERSRTQHQAEPRGRLRANAPITFGTMHLAD